MVKFLDLAKVTAMHGDEIRKAVGDVVDSGWYLQGDANRKFEKAYADFIGTSFCTGCASGLDALILVFRALIELGRLHRGDKVIVPANTYIASILAVTENGLDPVFVEPDPDTLQIDPKALEKALTPDVKALLLVHLYGRCAYNDEIERICSRHSLILIEDNAQAHGCGFKGRGTGSLGTAGCHSFYPGKNLGALGDGGAVTTDDKELADTVRSLANYGSTEKYIFRYCGRNSRLDEIQAAVLDVKLKYLDADNARRKRIADIYYDNIKNPAIRLPHKTDAGSNVYHLFPVFCDNRDELQKHLRNAGIETLIHYPVPPHRQECYRNFSNLELPLTDKLADTELSIPISPAMTDEEALSVVNALNSFRHG